jgi:hypothetical protein
LQHQKQQKHPRVLFLRLPPWRGARHLRRAGSKEGNLEGEPQVSPGVASLPVASGVREHIVGIANRFQTQAFMQRYTCLPRHTIVGDCAGRDCFVVEQVH